MLDQNVILDANDVRRNPVHGLSEARKSPVHDHEISLSHDRSRLVLQRWWDALDKVEEALPARCDMSAMLNVVSRPIAFGLHVVPLIKQRVECVQNKSFIFRFNRLIHFCSPNTCVRRQAFKNRVTCSTKSFGYWYCDP